MTQPLNVAIVGYGIAGIAAAIRLRRLGHQVTHFDRADPPGVAGAGMLLHPPALLHLEKLGLAREAIACGAPVRSIAARTTSGQSLLQMDYADLSDGPCGLGIQRGTLHRLLSQADAGREQVRGGHHITALDPHQGLLFDDARHRFGPFDLVVVADGAHSALREQLAGLVRRNQRSESAALVGLLHDRNGFAADRLMQYFDGPRHLSVWPVGCESVGQPRRCSVAMNVPLAAASTLLERGTWRDEMRRLRPDIGTLLDEDHDSSMHVFTYRDVDLASYSTGRTVLIGDAAHSMSPQLGVGAQTALQDAEVLADVLTQHGELAAALHAYTQIRRTQLSHYQQASRWLTPLFQSDSRLLSLIRDGLLARTMQVAVMKRFARTLLGH